MRCGPKEGEEHGILQSDAVCVMNIPPSMTRCFGTTPGETGSVMHFVRQSAQNLYGWLDWTVNGNLPLSFARARSPDGMFIKTLLCALNQLGLTVNCFVNRDS